MSHLGHRISNVKRSATSVDLVCTYLHMVCRAPLLTTHASLCTIARFNVPYMCIYICDMYTHRLICIYMYIINIEMYKYVVYTCVRVRIETCMCAYSDAPVWMITRKHNQSYMHLRMMLQEVASTDVSCQSC